jgi:hypothetical protein
MRSLIHIAVMVIVAAATLPNDADQLLRALLRDIPVNELSAVSQDESLSDIRSIVRERAERLADAEMDASQCRPACVDAASALGTICERHVLPAASMSRAVCYDRVDDDRAICLLACDDE